MLKLSQKKDLVARLATQLSEAQITILIDYKGLDVQTITRLRYELRQAGASMEVVKNTLLNLASQNTDAALMTDFYKGPTAVVTSATDPVAPSKILVDFAKDNEKLEIKAAAFGGKCLEPEEIKALAKMPSKEELLGKLVYTLNAVPTSFVNVLAGVPRGLLNVLNGLKDQKDAA
ncbi:50S ribosomal protein L10 [Desulfotignum balticum]|uniref:50S ribosomal protein L10 n=1 Tax=Desulfotignum balticum TaxID=115781 RepID=UPI00041DFAE4|nr:50S ribosomal protein L10 [Desulfotignum balticum]